MAGGGPQATRITQNPVGTPGIARRPVGTGRRPGSPGRRAAGLLLPPVLVMAVIFGLSAQPDLHSGLKEDFLLRKCAHVTEYVVLTLLWARAVAGLAGARPLLLRAAPLAGAAIALAWAASDEWHQSFVTGRVGTPRDVAIDAIGIAIALVLLARTRPGRGLVRRGP